MRIIQSRKLARFVAISLIYSITALVLPANDAKHAAAAEEQQRVQASTTTLFEENRGQHDERVKFAANISGGAFFLTGSEAVYVLPLNDKYEYGPEATDKGERQLAYALRMRFATGHDTQAIGMVLSEKRSNYFRGNEAARWQKDVPNYSEVRLNSISDGVDMVWKGRENGTLQYDLHVAPGTDPSGIRLEFDGADSLQVDEKGDLNIITPAGTITQKRPFTYQHSGESLAEIPSGFIVEGTTLRFDVGDYDTTQPLVIDPTVSFSNMAYSSFLGSFGDDVANSIAVDNAGYSYVTGRTSSVSFPTTAGTFDPTVNGSTDAFVTKMNPSGTGVVFSTYLGGSFGDEGKGIAVDSAGSVYITGFASISFPVTVGAYDESYNGGADVFVTKLASTGSFLVYSTYIGAAQNDFGNGLALDAAGNAYLVVRTSITGTGNDFPMTPGAFDTTHNGSDDVAVTKINPTGSGLVYSTFLGGSDIDVGTSIAVNAAGEAFVGGTTTDATTDLQTTAGAYDTTHNGATDFFASRINSDGTNLVYSTYIGGPGIDNASSLAIDAAGSVYIGGTVSTGFPTTAGVLDTTSGGSNEIGLTKLNPAGSALSYSTFLGGTQGESIYGIAIDSVGNCYLAAGNFGGDFPTTAGAFDTTYNGSNDALLVVVNLNATALIYSSYIGSSAADFAYGIALDHSGNAYLAGRTEFATPPFPTSVGAFQTSNSTGQDVFVAKFGDFAIGGRVIDVNGNPLNNVMVAMSGQSSGNMITGPDGRFGFTNTFYGQPHSVTATRPGYSFNPAVFNIGDLSNNRELTFVGATGTPTGGSGGTLAFRNLSTSKGENGTTITVDVERTGEIMTLEPVTVDVTTVNGSAIANQDFLPFNGPIAFQALETHKTITITLINDTILEPKESFRLQLSNPTNNSDIDPAASETHLTVLDDDLANGGLLISEFRTRGRLGAKDEYVKLFNPNDFDVTIFAADGSPGIALAALKDGVISGIATIPTLVTIGARSYYLFTNNSPNGGYSLIDYPTGRGTTAAVGDRTFTFDIPDNADIALLNTANIPTAAPENAVDSVGFGNGWTTRGKPLAAIAPQNSEFTFARRITAVGLQNTGSNAQDIILLDGAASTFESGDGKYFSVLGAPAPGTSESIPLVGPGDVTMLEFATPVWDPIPVPNGPMGTYTVYRALTNNTDSPIVSLRLRAADFPTRGTFTSLRTSARPDFRLMSSPGDGSTLGTTLAADRLQPAGGGINSTLIIDGITPDQPLMPGQTVTIALRFGIVRYGRFSFSAAIEALQ